MSFRQGISSVWLQIPYLLRPGHETEVRLRSISHGTEQRRDEGSTIWKRGHLGRFRLNTECLSHPGYGLNTWMDEKSLVLQKSAGAHHLAPLGKSQNGAFGAKSWSRDGAPQLTGSEGHSTWHRGPSINENSTVCDE